MENLPPWLDRFLTFLERLAYPVAFFTFLVSITYWYWTTTPSYALTAVVVSVKNRDVVMFEKYVDVNSVVSHAFDDILRGPISGEIMGRDNSFIGMGFVRFFKREIIELAHGKVDEFVHDGHLKLAENVPTTVNPITAMAVMNSGQILKAANGSKKEKIPKPRDDESKGDKLKRVFQEYGISRFGYQGVKYLRNDGQRALLGLEFFAPKLNKRWVAEFTLEDAGGHWEVTQLDNLNQIFDMYVKSREKT